LLSFCLQKSGLVPKENIAEMPEKIKLVCERL
jgi:hypothetical protein